MNSIDISNTDVNFDAELDNPLYPDELRENALTKAAECTDIPHFDVNFDSKGARFGNMVNDSEIQALIESQEIINTKKNTRWAFNIFESWRLERNSQGQGQEYDIPELISMDAIQLNFFLGRFIMRARKRETQPSTDMQGGKTPGDSKFLPLAVKKDGNALRYPYKLNEDQGIDAKLSGHEASALGLALDGPDEVEVIVQRSDFEKAKSIIEELETAVPDEIPAWNCKCGEEVDEGFGVCWSCGADYVAPEG